MTSSKHRTKQIIIITMSISKLTKDKQQIIKKKLSIMTIMCPNHSALYLPFLKVLQNLSTFENYLLESTDFGLGLSVPFCILIFICHHDKRLRSNPLCLLQQRYQTFISWHKSASPSESVLQGLEIFRATEINKRVTLNTDNYSEPPLTLAGNDPD